MPIRILPKTKAGDRHPRREWNSPERRRERQKEYMEKHGKPQPRRKTLGVTDKYKDVREQRKFSEAGFKPLRAAKARGGSVEKTKGPKGIGKPRGTLRDRLKKIKPKDWGNLHERFGGSEKAKPHSTKEGRVAAGRRKMKRVFQDANKPRPTRPWQPRNPQPDWHKRKPMQPLARGGKAGTGPSPGTRIKARKAREAEWWTGREGTQAVYNPTLDKKLREKRPHSSPEGRMRDVKTAYAKAAEERKKRQAVRKMPKYAGRPAASTKKFKPIDPQHRTSKGIGGVIKKGISKILKPKGVFKPKPKVDDIDKPFKGYDKSYTRADEKKVNSMLKKLGDEIKAQPLPPKLKETMKKLQKAYPHKKASGGRIGLKKGSVHKPGSHSWYLQHMNKNKKAEGGRLRDTTRNPHKDSPSTKPRRKKLPKSAYWRTGAASGGRANFRDGGSVGAALRGHGAVIK